LDPVKFHKFLQNHALGEPGNPGMSTVEKRLKAAGVSLPEAPRPVAAYVPFVKVGNLVFVSGQIPLRDGQLTVRGPVPSVVGPAEAAGAARQCVVNALAVLAAALDGDLDRVRRIVRLGVFVACDPGFDGQPQVANGASELLIEVFGDAGRHARAAVGSVGLPLGATVEVELIAEVEN
jgi:enamine deaminase RidA (YjgF/YER057c/UK114 family)